MQQQVQGGYVRLQKTSMVEAEQVRQSRGMFTRIPATSTDS
jgi:hypothetical protein